MLYEIQIGKKYSKVVDDAMTFVIKHLDLPNHVWVDIRVKKLPDLQNGWCLDLEDDGNHHFFEIEINKNMPREEMLKTIFHEMKHVEQAATGKLQQLFWQGKDYRNCPYDDRPWEIEAYSFEQDIIDLYRKRDLQYK